MAVKPAESVVILGCGDIGRRLGRLWRARGARAIGVARRAAEVRCAGLEPFPADLDRPDSLTGLPVGGALLYYLAPPPAQGEADPRLRGVLGALEAAPRRLVYISTSGVYGDARGAWVDETTPPAPGTDRARRRLDAERAVQSFSRERGVPHVILRVGGIYGPGRLPIEAVRAGRPMLRAELAGWTNRIHADDLARVCLAAGERGGGIYNVSDGRPGSIPELHRAVADALGLPPPPELDWAQARAALTPALLSYLSESRRLDTRRMRAELGIDLLYPDLASGLRACPELGGG